MSGRTSNPLVPEGSNEERRVDSSLRALAALGTIETFPEAHFLFREGDPAQALYVILNGQVRMHFERDDGKRFIVGVIGPGGLVGEVGLGGGPRTSSVETLTSVRCARIDYALVKQQLSTDPGLGVELLSLAYDRIRQSDGQIKSLALETVYQRLRELFGSHTERIDMTHQEIADRLGASRDMVTRIFRDLNQGGYIQTRKGSLVIVKALPRTW